MSTAIVVGSGPNGLAAAVTLAQAGVEVTVLEAADTIGGGTRTSELIEPGVWHDHCSAVHPMGVASPFLRSVDLESFGVKWCWPEVDLTHPLDGGRSGVLLHSLDDTVAGLGVDGKAWRGVFGPLTDSFDDLLDDLMRPIIHVPGHPIRLSMFGFKALQSTNLLARRWQTDEARALFAGVAAHSFHPFHRPTSASVGLMLTAVAHRHGWPVAAGGSQAITTALAGMVTKAGGTIETGVRVSTLAQVADADTVLFDLSPSGVADICGDALPGRVRRAYRRFKHGAAAYKVDFVVADGVPWTDEHSRRAGTVHVGGTFEQVAAAESAVSKGQMPERPFVLVAQQYLADPSRSNGNHHPIWAYAHVPAGYTGDATEAVIAQIERFAPGFRDRIIGMHVTRADEWQAYNANYIGGDIATGANGEIQVVFRPRIAVDPYFTGAKGMFICSAATPPGAGVHGMGGYNAAQSALRRLKQA